MIWNPANWPHFSKYARLMLAVLVLAGLASAAAPLATNASGPLCTLSCCAGRAPHAAGSCMNGACHAFLRQGQSSRSHVHTRPAELFCGLSRFDKAAQSSISRIRTNSSAEPIEFRSALTRPCDANCRSCGASLSSTYRSQNLSIASHRPQPLPARRYLDFRSASIPTFSAQCDRCAPRGPPKTFS
jgi:hypothetical protein